MSLSASKMCCGCMHLLAQLLPALLQISIPFKKPQIKSMKQFNMWRGPLEEKEGIQPDFKQMYKDEKINMFQFKYVGLMKKKIKTRKHSQFFKKTKFKVHRSVNEPVECCINIYLPNGAKCKHMLVGEKLFQESFFLMNLFDVDASNYALHAKNYMKTNSKLQDFNTKQKHV